VRIGLNLLHALPEIGGGWNYIENLVTALGECDDTNTYIAFVTRVSECLVPAQSNFEKVLINIRSESRPQRILYENTLLQGLAYQHRLDCMHWFANVQAVVNTVPSAVTIYDLQAFVNPSVFPPVQRVYLRWRIPSTVRRAAVLLPISQATGRALKQILAADPKRMLTIPPILESQFEPVAAEEVKDFRAKYRLPERFWLYVAHLYPHKNHVCLLRAYHRLKGSGFEPWPLVLRGDPIGAEADVHQTLRQLNLEQDVIWLPRLERTELPVLYSSASALIFPSLYEGGGIPVIEAMACGCPVAASSIPAVMEFGGEAVSYFDPKDVKAIGQAMMTLQCDAKQQESSRKLGFVRAIDFRASKVIDKLLTAYSKALAK
jgi:glycosyltransferase involved in cell wall biosynthesis